MKTQSGCNDGVLKTPGAIGLRIEQAGTSFVEGLKMDLNGHVADCIVSRNYNLTESQALSQRNIVIQNSQCRGSRGTWDGHPYGDYTHADFFQNQGAPNAPINRIVFENITQLTTASGVVLDGKINEAVALNYEFAPDTRYKDYIWVLNPLWLTGKTVVFKNIYTAFDDKSVTGAMPVCVRNEYLGKYYSFKASGGVEYSSEVKQGRPPKEFAPWDKIGLKYKSPHP